MRRPTRRPKAMLTAFIVVFVVASFAGTIALDASLAVRFPYLASLAAQFADQTEPTVLSLGSSRTSGYFDVNRVTNLLKDRRLVAFNAAVHGSTLTTHEQVLVELLRSGKPPALVTIEVNPEFLHRRLCWVHPQRDVVWSNFIEIARDLAGRRGGRLVETRVLPLYARRFEIRLAAWKAANAWFARTPAPIGAALQTLPPAYDGRIEGAPPAPLMTDSLREAQRRLAPPPLVEFSPNGAAARALERMLAECRNRDIPVLLVDAPLCSLSRESLAPVERDYRSYIQSVLERFPNARYFDAKDALPDSAFVDQHHANEYGRYLMSERLASTVIPKFLDTWRDRVASGGVRHGMARLDETPTAQ